MSSINFSMCFSMAHYNNFITGVNNEGVMRGASLFLTKMKGPTRSTRPGHEVNVGDITYTCGA